MRVLAAPDKFRGSASAAQVAAAVADGARACGATCRQHPLADGGEGTLEAFGGGNRVTEVTGPLGRSQQAAWRLDGDLAVIEMARAAGLQLVGGASCNDAVAATTRGVGELIAAAVDAGARTVVVGVGGSATTDGGWGAVQALADRLPLRDVDLVVAADVTTTFVDAAEEFAPQKGASPTEVGLLRQRLRERREQLQRQFGVDVGTVPGSGAAGGLAGGLVAIGARIRPGFDVVAEHTGLDLAIDEADLVVTGEGLLDRGSFRGKVVGGVLARASSRGVPVLAVVGDRDGSAMPAGLDVLAILDRYGDRAWTDTTGCIRDAVTSWLSRR